jgi:hypothetical protein
MKNSSNKKATSLKRYIETLITRNIQKDEYYRALNACLAIVSDNTDITNSFVSSWKPDYGVAIVKTRTEFDPLSASVYVIGLDGWEFTIDNQGKNNAITEDELSITLVGNLPIGDFKTFIENLTQAESKKGNIFNALPGF